MRTIIGQYYNILNIVQRSLAKIFLIIFGFIFSHPDEINTTEMLGCMEAMRPGSVGFVV
jgi:hypothetical protein